MDIVVDFNWEKFPTSASNEHLSDSLRDEDRWLPEKVVSFLPKELQDEYNSSMDADLEVIEMEPQKKNPAKKTNQASTVAPMYKKVRWQAKFHKHLKRCMSTL